MAQKKKSKTGKGTPTWPTVVKKRSQVDDPFPPLQASRVEGQENSDTSTQVEALRSDGGGVSTRSGTCSRANAKGGCAWTKSTSKTARLFQTLSGNTTDGSGNANANGSRTTSSSRSFSKAASSSSSCSADGESSLITQEVETSHVKEEMTGLLLGGGREANSIDTGDGTGGACRVGDDDDSHSAIVRPQILFRDGGSGGGSREECDRLVGNDGGGGDPCGKVIESPWDLPNPFMLSAFTGLGLNDGGSSTCSASAILREKQRQQRQNGDGPSPPSSSYFSFSTNSPARKNAAVGTCSKTSGTGNSKSNQFSDGGFGGIGMMATPTPYHLHNALQHQAHQPLPPEQFRNAHQYHLHLNPVHNGGGIGGEHNNYIDGGPAAPGAPFSSSITSGSPSMLGGGSGPMAFPGPAAGAWHCGPPPMHVSGGPLYQNGGVCGGGGMRNNVGWAPDTFDIGGLRYPIRSIPLLYSPYDVFQSGQHPPQWHSFQRRHTQYS